MSLHRSLLRIPKTLITPFRKLVPFFQINYYSVNTHVISNVNDQNLNPKNPKIVQEAERICKILLNTTCSTKCVTDALGSVSVNVSPLLVEEVVKKLSNSGVLALSFFRWAEKQNGFVHTSESYHGLIEALGKIKQFKMVWILVDELKKKGLLCKESFALISRRYARARKVKEAIEAFERMEKYGLVVELQDFNRLLDTLSKSRNVGKAQEVFDKWKNKRKFKPNIKSYTILLEGWGGEKNLLRLNEVYQEMKADDIEPDVVSYGIMIHAHCKVKKYGEAIELLREMERKKIRVTPHVYCTLINGLGSEKRLVEALKYFELYKGSGFDLEVFTFNAMVGAYCWSMRMDDAYKLLDEMRRSKIGPNTRTYDIILHHLIKARRTNEAYLVFQKMSNDPGCEPTVSTYEIMVRMFCNEDRTDMALRVWDQMKARGVLPGMHMFSTLINSFCHENRLDDACTYFQEMLDMGMRPPLPLFDNLKRALPEEGKEDTVKALWRKLEKLRKSNLVG
ncbi:pentatricopeptide repeat-containing protein At1g77360, mitochondrial-like [Nicotiana tabacum]|uniref:Pentatricopeptide repeat-containing protein At1g77360, mitochondrial-like n=3 Tax=Nicotiana TaxID=4085 RepID=A0AC58TJ37_TOBAC|nr:PREDICTED: pentatricopeptide repeat-containing protein At1g71060, mitochondrial-like [Nicotiana sylvestris]XP_009788330.1 PREDICTED: pentatricopeptide repeat-containing protein At1g71060, mitochondrial-like [Nicotiana sylvestris]XP_016447909.1 PREDICTED: pentatricopeptide repeat-containing protein At1g71060, mitochondrial-like [Nicotiana tabacum]